MSERKGGVTECETDNGDFDGFLCGGGVNSISSSVNRGFFKISTISTSHEIDSWVAEWRLLCVTDFLNGGGPLLALRYLPFLVLSKILDPSLTGSHSTDESSWIGISWITLFPLAPSKNRSFKAVKYLP